MQNFVLSFLLCIAFNLDAQIEVSNYFVGNIDCTRDKGFVNILEVGGGKSPYNYQWSNGSSTENVTNLTEGSYSVTIYDSNIPPKAGFATFEIKADTIMPFANAGGDKNLTCSVTEVVLDGTGSSSNSYRWSTPNGVFSNTFPLANIIAKAPGTYMLKVVNPNTGCFDSDTVLVSQSADMPIADAGTAKTLFCSNPELQLDGTGSSSGLPGYTYEWQNLTGSGIVSGGNSLTPTVDQSGKFWLKVINQNTGCFSIGSVDVVEDVNNLKAYFPQPLVHINCEYDTLPLHLVVDPIGGNFTYQWQTWGTPMGHIISGQGTPDILVDSAGTYVVTVTNTQNGCKDIESLGIEYYFSTPVINASNDVFLGCDNIGSANLKVFNLAGGTPAAESLYYWYDQDGNWLNPYKQSDIVVNEAGQYIVKVFDCLSKCFDVDTVYVFTKETFAQVAQVSDTLTCLEPIISLDASNSINGVGYALFWSTLDGHLLGDLNSPIIQTDSDGIYKLVIQNIQFGCADTAYVIVTSNITAPTAITLSEQILPCNPHSILLNGIGCSIGTNIQYTWTTSNGHILEGHQNLSPKIDETGLYTLTVLDKRNGCTSSSTTLVEDPPAFSIGAEVKATSCNGSEDGSIKGIAFPELEWSLAGSAFSLNAFFKNLGAGSYELLAKDSFGCLENLALMVEEPGQAWVNLGDDLAIEAGNDTVLIFTTNIPDDFISSIQWHENGISQCSGCEILSINPSVESIYELTVVDSNGCVAQDALTVKMLDAEVYVPNAFTPNGDGQNDYFLVFSNDKGRSIKSFQVFSRWGELMFENEDILPNVELEGWDGMFRGKQSPEGIYIWHMVIIEEDKTIRHQTGDILLIRNH